MTADAAAEALAILAVACDSAGLDASGAEPIRLGENALLRLPGGVVARIARPGQHAAAEREILIARWLADHGVPAVRPADGLDQPVVVEGRAVTFWDELPPHRTGTVVEVANALRRLHRLPPPTRFTLPALDPFVRVRQRIDTANVLSDADRAWMWRRLADLQDRYRDLPAGLPQCVVHGDASNTNIAVPDDGTIILVDLERCTIGPPEWDLTSIAVELGYQWISHASYRQFCDRYGHDVTAWGGYAVLRDVRELRMSSWLAQQASEHPEHRAQAIHRLEYLQDKHGPRPWTGWQALT